MCKTRIDTFFPGLLEFLFNLLQELSQMASWTENIFILILFFQGFAVCSILLSVFFVTDWRVLETQNSTRYKSGLIYVGIWELCFPPTVEGPDGYSIYCCHKFSLFEKFFPVEMKMGQILIPAAFCLSILGLVFFGLAHEWRGCTIEPARWIFIAAGISYIIASICIIIPISWNVNSVAQKKFIPFPISFRLPPVLVQRTGQAVMEGYISSILLFISGTYIIGRGFMTPDSIFPILSVQNLVP